jgi:hypothetical protein
LKVDVNILGDALGKIANAISEITKSLDKYLSNSEVRRMRKCIKYGDLIINRINELKIEDKELKKFVKVWEVYNN